MLPAQEFDHELLQNAQEWSSRSMTVGGIVFCMDPRVNRILRAIAVVASPDSRGRVASELSEALNLSSFYAQRQFTRYCGDTPGTIRQRITLGRAAAAIRTTDQSVLSIGLDAGYQSHEAFTRAFVRTFGMTPCEYRSECSSTEDGARHQTLVGSAGPCLTLYRRSLLFDREPIVEKTSVKAKEGEMAEEITTREQLEQPVLQIRRRINHDEISSVLGELLPQVYEYAIQSGAEFAGAPYCGYREWTPGGGTVEAGLPVAERVDGSEEIESSVIPAGTFAVAVHEGEYDTLNRTHALLDSWLERRGHGAGSVRYEIYLTDPGQYPDPSQWRTEVTCVVKQTR